MSDKEYALDIFFLEGGSIVSLGHHDMDDFVHRAAYLLEMDIDELTLDGNFMPEHTYMMMYVEGEEECPDGFRVYFYWDDIEREDEHCVPITAMVM